MEDGIHTSKQSLISSKCTDGAPCCFEHTIVEDGLMSHSPRMQTVRYGKDDMEVLSRDDFFPAESDPLLTLLVLALGAMTIPAAVIADTDIPAFWTNLHMSAKGVGPAKGHVLKGSSDRCYDVMTTKEFSSMVPDNLTKVVGSPHFFLGGKMVSISRTCFIGSMSAT